MKAIIENNISRVTIAIAILGLTSEFLTQNNLWSIYLRKLIDPLLLSFYMFDFVGYFIRGPISIGLFFYFVMLYGAFTFIKKRDGRLIKFCFALIFVQNTVSVLSSIIGLVLLDHVGVNSMYINLTLQIISNVAYAIVGYTIVKYLLESEEAAFTERQLREKPIRKYLPADKNKRFLHLLIDLVFAMSTLSLVLAPYLHSIARMISPRFSIVFLLGITRLIYYLVFEISFSSTPAKMLTDTKVVDNNGNNPSWIVILGRTFARWIPFEPLSFLGLKGWHDNLSNTQVCIIKDIPERSKIWWLLPLFISINIAFKKF